MNCFESYNEADTIRIAEALAAQLKAGDIVTLSGDLGAGKTAFVKGVAMAFDSKDEVTSPTFTLVNQYDGQLTVYHFDAYRLENVSPEECDWLDDYLFGDGVCLIEWAENIRAVLPCGCIEVVIEKNPEKGEDYRKITIKR